MVGVRDPHGFRPLALGRLKDGYVMASETCALDQVGAEYIRDINPGEAVYVGKDGIRVNITALKSKSNRPFVFLNWSTFRDPIAKSTAKAYTYFVNDWGKTCKKSHR